MHDIITPEALRQWRAERREQLSVEMRTLLAPFVARWERHIDIVVAQCSKALKYRSPFASEKCEVYFHEIDYWLKGVAEAQQEDPMMELRDWGHALLRVFQGDDCHVSDAFRIEFHEARRNYITQLCEPFRAQGFQCEEQDHGFTIKW